MTAHDPFRAHTTAKPVVQEPVPEPQVSTDEELREQVRQRLLGGVVPAPESAPAGPAPAVDPGEAAAYEAFAALVEATAPPGSTEDSRAQAREGFQDLVDQRRAQGEANPAQAVWAEVHRQMQAVGQQATTAAVEPQAGPGPQDAGTAAGDQQEEPGGPQPPPTVGLVVPEGAGEVVGWIRQEPHGSDARLARAAAALQVELARPEDDRRKTVLAEVERVQGGGAD